MINAEGYSKSPVIRGTIQNEGCYVQVQVGPLVEGMGESLIERSYSAVALIDTGAATSIISRRAVQALGLTPSGVSGMTTAHSKGLPVEAPHHRVWVVFENGSAVGTTAVEVDFGARDDLQFMIGRDVLDFGRFVYRGKQNEWILDFSAS